MNNNSMLIAATLYSYVENVIIKIYKTRAQIIHFRKTRTMNKQKHLQTSVVINGNKESVWKVLTQLGDYQNWNPFIIKSEGTIKIGNQITNTMVNGKKEMTFKPKITSNNPNVYFEWVGHLYLKGLFDGRHYFKLEEVNEGKTKVTQGEYFSGVLANVILKSIWKNTEKGFTNMNLALKKEVEKVGTKS